MLIADSHALVFHKHQMKGTFEVFLRQNHATKILVIDIVVTLISQNQVSVVKIGQVSYLISIVFI